MRHDMGCGCEQCTAATTATSDTILVGLLMIAGVVIAITTASRIVAAVAIGLLVMLVVAKLRTKRRAQNGLD